MLLLELLEDPKQLKSSNMYQLATVAGRETHLISRITLIEKVSFSDHEIKERLKKTLDPSSFLTYCEIELVKPILKHVLKLFKSKAADL